MVSHMNNWAVGYISSSPFWHGTYLPQRIQNIVVRDYCYQNDLKFLWSLPEVSSPDLLFSFHDLLQKASLGHVKHIVAISYLMHDNNTWDKVVELASLKKLSLHFAFENTVVDLDDLSSARDNLFEIKLANKINSLAGDTNSML